VVRLKGVVRQKRAGVGLAYVALHFGVATATNYDAEVAGACSVRSWAEARVSETAGGDVTRQAARRSYR